MVNAKTGIAMTKNSSSFSLRTRRSSFIRLGYVRLLDAAPLIAAECLDMFRDAGLNVELSREAGWATIRDKLAFEELDVVQALSPMPFVMRRGIGVAKTEVVAGMVLNTNGNAITLSKKLREYGVQDGDGLRRYIKNGYKARKLVIGVVSQYSSHHFMLCRWLQSYHIDPRKDVIISVLPPEQMVRNLIGENIDGFCVGEPWGSLAVEEGFGWVTATSSQIANGYPEKVLATTERFISYRPDEYNRMIEVLLNACAYCQDPNNHTELFKILSRPEYLNCSPRVLSHAFSNVFPNGLDDGVSGAFVQFSGTSINRPDVSRASEVYKDLCKFISHESLTPLSKKALSRIYKADIFDQVTSTVAS